MPPQKFVDGDFLSRLLAGSHEAFMDAAEEAVQESAELFGGSDTVSVRTLGTFPTYALVLNSEGNCFRANFAEDKQRLTIKTVVSEEMPVYGSQHVVEEARRVAEAAVQAMMENDCEGAAGPLAELSRLVSSGVPISAWSYTRDIEEWLTHSDGWRRALSESSHVVDQLFLAEGVTDDFSLPLESDTDSVDGLFQKSLGRFYSQLRESVARWQAELAPLKTETFDGAFGEFVTDLAEDVDALGEIQSAMIEFLEGPGASTHVGNLAEVTGQLAEHLPVVSRGVVFATAFSRRQKEKVD